MNDHDDSIRHSLPVDALPEISRLCVEFEQAWRTGQSPRVEDFAARLRGDAHIVALVELIAQEVDLRWAVGQPAEPAEYHQRFPSQPRAVNAAFALLHARGPTAAALPDTVSLRAANPSETDHSRRPAGPKLADAPIPQRLGRFEIKRRLGKGAFSDVYLAHDPELNRRVALKVPRRDRFSSREEMEIFVKEARTAAGLIHPGIVTIHDVVTDSDLLFIVQEYVDGQDLDRYLKSVASDLPIEQAASMLMSIAEAVSFAHGYGFVHRDLKPANILLDAWQRPRVADFGLAVHESVQRRQKGDRPGTPAYMSPEQVRGETHLLGRQSDIWSLGVILYELLTGRRPFQGDTRDELFDEITHRDPRPPSQRRQQVPAELDRICLRCLSKRVTDRYLSALDLIDDLRLWSGGVRTQEFAAKLAGCPAGREQFSAFESIGIAVLQYLFSEHLGEPKPQEWTLDGKQRRDVLFRNNRSSRFFERLFHRFDSDFVIVDFKNYGDVIEPDVITDVDKYANKALGRFILVVSRKGQADTVEAAQVRTFRDANTVVLVVSDIDLLEMIQLKERGEIPEYVLEEKLDKLLRRY